MGARQFKVVLVGGHHIGSYTLISTAAEAARPWLNKNYPVVIRQDTGHNIEITPGAPPTITLGRGLRTPPRMGANRRPTPQRHPPRTSRHRCPMTTSAATAGPRSTPTRTTGAPTAAAAKTRPGTPRPPNPSTPPPSNAPANKSSSRYIANERSVDNSRKSQGCRSSGPQACRLRITPMFFPRSEPVDRHREAAVRATAAADLIRHAAAGDLPLLQAVTAARRLLTEAGTWEAWPHRPPRDLGDDPGGEEEPF